MGKEILQLCLYIKAFHQILFGPIVSTITVQPYGYTRADLPTLTSPLRDDKPLTGF
jgi:hypothetical protein